MTKHFPKPVRPELVEGVYFSLSASDTQEQSFDIDPLGDRTNGFVSNFGVPND